MKRLDDIQDGDVLKIAVPVDARGLWRTLRGQVRIDIAVVVKDGKTSLLVREPVVESHR